MKDMSERDVVTVRGLRKTYGTRVVVDRLDLRVRVGEIVGLVGANGAGKTTTVECIQGLRRPDAGVLSVLGRDPVTQAEQVRPLIGSQLQDSALPDRLRCQRRWICSPPPVPAMAANCWNGSGSPSCAVRCSPR